MAPEFYILRTFIIGFCLGIGLFVFLHVKYRYSSHEHSENCIIDRYKINTSHQRTYDSWFEEMGFRKQILNNDELRYTDIHGETESEWLHRTVSVVCVVYTSNPKNVVAVNETWSKSCNEVIFYSKNSDNYKPSVPASKSNVTSSFHLLCDVINKVVKDYPHIKWALFVKDDMFVIPENLRRMVAALDPWQGHYLGHTISFWGVSYNMALAGFVLSAGAMRRLGNMFPNTTACIQGGKYWKQEDMYLGKHLRSMNIYPVDTRDEEGFSAFIGYDLDKMMFPGSTQQFTIYNTRALYPPKCCGSRIVTFPVLSSTEMYTYHNMIYKLRIFTSGTRGNRPAPTAVPELQVWQDFLREEGLALNSSDAQYEQSWYIKFGNATAIPGIFGARELDVRKRLGGPNKLFNPTNMPEVLEYMLSNYTAKKAKHTI